MISFLCVYNLEVSVYCTRVEILKVLGVFLVVVPTRNTEILKVEILR